MSEKNDGTEAEDRYMKMDVDKPTPDKKVTPTKVRVGGVHVSIWKNESKNGRNKHSISVQRIYRKADGTWANTQYLRLNDIPKLILALQKAYEEITLCGTVTTTNDVEG